MLNNLKTAALLAGLGALCMFVGSFWGTNGLIIGLAIGLAMTAGSYWFSDRLAIRSAGAVEVDETQMPQYHAIVASWPCGRRSPNRSSTCHPNPSRTPSPPAAIRNTPRCASPRGSCAP